MQLHDLEEKEEHQNGTQGHRHLLQIGGQGGEKEQAQLPGVLRDGDGGVLIGTRPRAVDDAQDEHRQDGAHRAQGHQAETVAFRVAVAADGGHAGAQSHNKGDGHGSGGDAAGVEGHRQKLRWNKGGQEKDQNIKADEQMGEVNPQQHAQHGDHQEQTDAHGHRENEGHVGYPRYLLSQDLEVGLRHGDEDAHHQAHQHHHPNLSRPGDGGTHMAADGDHGHVRPQSKETHADDEQGSAQDEPQQQVVGHRGDGEAQQEHDARDRQN